MGGHAPSDSGGLPELLGGVVRGYLDWNERLAGWLEENRPAIRRLLEGVGEFYESFPLALALASGVFAKGGWSEVPLANMDLRETTALLKRLRDMREEDLWRELDGVVLAYFRRDGHAELRAMVEGWDGHFPERRETFAQALFAHEEGCTGSPSRPWPSRWKAFCSTSPRSTGGTETGSTASTGPSTSGTARTTSPRPPTSSGSRPTLWRCPRGSATRR